MKNEIYIRPFSEEKSERLKKIIERGKATPLYRVWDYNLGSYNDDLRLSPTGVLSDLECNELSPDFKSIDGERSIYSKRKYNTFCIIEKCTQKLDKNKTNIYEGDVVYVYSPISEKYDGHNVIGYKKEPAVVAYDNGNFHYRFGDFRKISIQSFDSVEIIGNVHEISLLFKSEVKSNRFDPLPIHDEKINS